VLFTDDSLGGVIEAMKAVAQGDLVSIMGYRAYDFSSLEADLLGGRVRFPYGAFSLAAAARCPVVVLLSAKTGVRSYLCDVSHIIAPPVATRLEREAAVKRAVQEFASILETYAQEHPYQWFVFRDIWTSNG
jgi:predicted LPLAT superfamily acyltransferase